MRIPTLLSILALSVTAATAQPANPNGSTPAVSGKGTNPDAPVAGSNSFTRRSGEIAHRSRRLCKRLGSQKG